MSDTTELSDIQPEVTTGVHIERLIAFSLSRGLLQPLDAEAARNALLDLFRLSEPAETDVVAETEELPDSPVPLLEPLLDEAARLGLIPDDTLTYRDLFDARIMGLLLPRPSETERLYLDRRQQDGVMAATDWFYRLNIDANYIRMDRIRKNGYWRHATSDGELEITINLSKPEKDPREIALLKTLPPARYPKCLLCKENVGYAGRPDHPARQNLRILPLALQGENWYFQYSPYVYYNEHSIVFRGEHVPMKISPETFARLLDFVEQFPHYFIGSNADLPIVGGSILNHDHFQAGRHVFPMQTASVSDWFAVSGESAVRAGIVRWPMSVLRLRSQDRGALLRVCGKVLARWRDYSDPSADVFAYTGETPHNTITPIARLRDDGEYEMDLVLRNNRTSDEFPDGIFHPHPELHHIKKENIGLIEVMGLAVLPGRLQEELAAIGAILSGTSAYDPAALAEAGHPLHKHAPWISELVAEHGLSLAADQTETVLRAAVGNKFHAVLSDAGVFKSDARGQEAFRRFLGDSGMI
ncbi:UDP-glucose--hexose-1-phosphate uridylyltransferase [Cohnella sp. CFH 77786]|uniref:UDP-glucose--hexose-1-phosphate uridylyltransferase n=1 Tax=Cohnella sp. CFH 77786 TaxID=2662265 RepID=UPI001C60A442|nr:UDP-glucose--hexose-1-phosphate uridylyltransferase [Cohnella sp. CFH 77786]MBW5447924.1 UDP-glucose--hexose-1-phosphate uridylyltransferase [Cohnella sp. CFH 77786]